MVRLFLPPISIVSISSFPLYPSGTGAVYSFDPVGSYEREACRAAGAAQSLVQPFLDNQASPLHLYFISNYPCSLLLYSFLPTSPTFSSLMGLPFQNAYVITDLLQKPGRSCWNGTPNPFTAARCIIHRYRFIHECHRAPHRGKLSPPAPPIGYF